MSNRYRTSFALDVLTEDTPYIVDVEFVHHPYRYHGYYDPPEPEHIEVTAVEIWRTVATADGSLEHQKLECPDWLSEIIAESDYTHDQCMSSVSAEWEMQADYRLEK